MKAFNYFFAPCRRIQTPHSVKLLVVSGFRENFARKIRNPGLCTLEYSSRNPEFTNDWNPESKYHCQRLKSSTWNPESTASNPESKTVLDSLTRGGSFFVGALVVGEEKGKKLAKGFDGWKGPKCYINPIFTVAWQGSSSKVKPSSTLLYTLFRIK